MLPIRRRARDAEPAPAAPAARSGSHAASMRASMASSVASDSLNVSAPKNLIPLSSYGLCDAEMTAARSRPYRVRSSAAAGVGSTPPSRTSPPAEAIPAASAASSISPDSRVSRITSTRGLDPPTSRVAAAPIDTASCAVSTSPATPRTPSVPKCLRTDGTAPFADPPALNGLRPLALGELRLLAGLLQAGLLAFLDARVTRQEAAALELATQAGIGLEQPARDAVAQRAGLRADPAAVDAGDDVHAVLVADDLERLADVATQRGTREVRVERLAVDRVGARARTQDHASDGRLALARRAVASTCGKVDRRGDRLLVGAVLLGRGLDGGLLFLVRTGEWIGTLGDDVDLEVGARNRGLDAGRDGLVVVLVLFKINFGLCGCGGLRSGRSGLGLRRLGRRVLRRLGVLFDHEG